MAFSVTLISVRCKKDPEKLISDLEIINIVTDIYK